MEWHSKALKMDNEGKSISYISDALNIPYKTVQKFLWRYKQKVKTAEGQEEIKPDIQDKGSYYIITSKKRTIEITKAKLKQLKDLYCDGSDITINQVCYKLDMPRRDFILVKTAFNITHDDVPYIDEEFIERPLEELVNETLEKRKEQYFIKLQQEEIKQLRKEVNTYREKDYYLNKIHNLVTEHLEEFEKYYDGPKTAILPKNNSGKMLEVSIVDLHLGKLTWESETGQNYDMKIASKKFMNVIYDIVDRTKDMDLEKIILPIGNDFFNFDNIEGKTTQGTPQDNDSRIHKMYGTGTELLIKTIDILKEIAPVEAFLVPGNHDMLISYYAVDKIKTHFRNEPKVNVNEQPTTRKYIEFGKCLIGFTHGDKEGKRIFGNMQQEMPVAWGRTKYREWHLGHLHSEQVKEEFGIKVRSLSSITGTDAWHYQKGYVGAIPASQSFIWDKEKGLRNIIYTIID